MTPAPIDGGLRAGLGAAGLSLLASGSTLLCCALPALLVALGAGATLAGLVSAAPWLVWLSAHKTLTFGGAAGLLLLAGAMLRQARRLPCPADARQAAACTRLRRLSWTVYSLSLVLYLVGLLFAVVLPWLMA